MPQTIGLALAFIASNVTAIAGFNVAVQATVAAFAAGLGGAALAIGLNFALGALGGLFRPPQPRPQDVQTTIRAPAAPRFRSYGRVKVARVLAHMISDFGFLNSIGAHGSGEIDAIEEHWIDDTEVTIDGNDDVTTAKYVFGAVKVIHIETRLGTTTQSAFAGIIGWTADHIGKGIPTSFVRLQQVSSDFFLDTFPNGINTNYRQVQRAALIFDPNDGGHDIDDATTWEWSDNAARVILDYLIHADGLKLSTARITPLALASFQAAATICDEAITLKAGGTEARYRIWNSYQFNERPADILSRFLEVCDGQFIPTPDGGLGLSVGKWSVPTVTLDDNAIIGFDDVGRGYDALSTANTIKAQFASPDHDYQAVEADPWIDAADVTARGEFVRDLQLYASPSHAQTRRLQKLAARRSNPNWTGTLICNKLALPVLGERFINVNFTGLGINETFEVLNVGYLLGANSILHGLTVQVASLAATAYDWVAASEEGTAPAEPAPVSGSNTIPVPENFSVVGATRAVSGNILLAYAVLDWDAATHLQGEAQFKATADSTWLPIAVGDGENSADSPILDDGIEYQFRVRFRSKTTSRFSAAGYTSIETLTAAIDADIAAAVTAMIPQPPALRTQLIIDYITALKAETDLWEALTHDYLLAAHAQQPALLNIRDPGINDLTTTGSPVFTVDEGFMGASGKRLESGFDYVADGFLRDDNHLSVWSLTDLADNNGSIGAEQFYINPRDAADAVRYRNSSTSTDSSGSSETGDGFKLISRDNGSDFDYYDAGAFVLTETRTSAVLAGSFDFWILAFNQASPIYVARQIASASWGEALTAAQVTAFYDAKLAYLQAVGAVA